MGCGMMSQDWDKSWGHRWVDKWVVLIWIVGGMDFILFAVEEGC